MKIAHFSGAMPDSYTSYSAGYLSTFHGAWPFSVDADVDCVGVILPLCLVRDLRVLRFKFQIHSDLVVGTPIGSWPDVHSVVVPFSLIISTELFNFVEEHCEIDTLAIFEVLKLPVILS